VLVKPDGDKALLITQQAHAFVSGQLARAWGNERFPAPQPRREVCLAAEQHDLGMASFDLDPTINPDTGFPHSFMEMPLDTHLEIWTHAPLRMLAQDRYAAMLVALHGIALYQRREPSRPVLAFLDAQREFVDSIAADLGVGREEIERNQGLIWTFDSLSLALLLDWDPFTLDVVEVERRGSTLDPWPFAEDTLTVACDGRRLERGADLAQAPWHRVEIVLKR
jgi:hypothetical protein